jgi:hypothetical protein
MEGVQVRAIVPFFEKAQMEQVFNDNNSWCKPLTRQPSCLTTDKAIFFNFSAALAKRQRLRIKESIRELILTRTRCVT